MSASEKTNAAATISPKWDAQGLMTAVLTHVDTGDVLMVAHMNEAALAATLASKEAHFWSRSRQSLWHKGASSGHVMDVVELRIDCDQDALWLKVRPRGPACHTGALTCFYRHVAPDGTLRPDHT